MNSHLAQIDNRATEMYDLLMKQLAEKEGITEQLKEQDKKLRGIVYSFDLCNK